MFDLFCETPLCRVGDQVRKSVDNSKNAAAISGVWPLQGSRHFRSTNTGNSELKMASLLAGIQ